MVYTLWWLETLLAGLACCALGVALLLGRRAAIWPGLLGVCLLLAPVGAAGMFALIATSLALGKQSLASFVPGAWGLAALLGLSLPALLFAGWRPLAEENDAKQASRWPVGGLAVSLLGLLGLFGVTFWWLDAQALQHLSELRVESARLARTVAPPPVPDEQNGAPLYRAAYRAMGPTEKLPQQWRDLWCMAYEEGEEPIDLDDPQLRAFLRQQSPALELTRQAAARPVCHFARDYEQADLMLLLPEVSELRVLENLLSLRAIVSAHDGDLPAALADVQAQLHMARHVASEPIFISLLSASFGESNAWRTLHAVLKRSPGYADVQTAAWQLETGPSFLSRAHDALVMEEVISLNQISVTRDLVALNELSGPVEPAQPTLNGSLGPLVAQLSPLAMSDLPSVGLAGLGPVFRVFFVPGDIDRYRAMMHRAQALARRPYYQALGDWRQWSDDAESRGHGVFTPLIMEDTDRYIMTLALRDADRQAVLASLAAIRYHADHGHWPTRLEQLTPKYLATLPIDPFTGQPFRSLLRDGRLTFYSLGPDQIDDGAVPMEFGSDSGDILMTLPQNDPPTP